MNEQLRAQLLARMETDQDVRNEALRRWPAGTPVDTDDPLHHRWLHVDRDNTAWLAEVIDTHGWPGRRLVGDDGANAAWLLAQHADHDPAFQRRCLVLLTAAVAAGDADPANLAYLTDRVAVHEHRPQVYGTQLRWDGERSVPAEIADPELVDQRRAEVGLMPLAEYLALTQSRHSSRRRLECESDGDRHRDK